MTWEHLENPHDHPELIGSVIVAKLTGEYHYEDACLPYRMEYTHEGSIRFTFERRSCFNRSFLFEPFAVTEDWTALRRWRGTSVDDLAIRESESGPLDNYLGPEVPYFLFSRNGKIWATREGIRLADDYEGHAFFTSVEICGELYFDCKDECDWDAYWDDP